MPNEKTNAQNEAALNAYMDSKGIPEDERDQLPFNVVTDNSRVNASLLEENQKLKSAIKELYLPFENSFWIRLNMFVAAVNVDDPISKEEKDFILDVCTKQIGFRTVDIKNMF